MYDRIYTYYNRRCYISFVLVFYIIGGHYEAQISWQLRPTSGSYMIDAYIFIYASISILIFMYGFLGLIQSFVDEKPSMGL